ncbi:helix-turn-helix domain-containing protein, partial [Pseudomaricurvus alkylphenolicus]|uniref:helix-turn-helix domain-containing protein n=1 Tax=Pseudomaricurvus alkylphenolicus TaxID=1306991 RepID=UPI0014216780
MGSLLTMGQKQLDRLTILERVKDRRLTQSEAARLLGISDRQVRRLYSAYSDQGAQALVSKHYGRT